MHWIDSHCHLSDLRMADSLSEVLSRARRQGVKSFLQGGVGPEDWQRQRELQQRYPEVLPCFGLHPYWVADHSQEDCEQALDLLARALPQSVGIGEMGLDFRPAIVKDSQDRQWDFFEKQIELAQLSSKSMVLHVVRAFDEAVKAFEIHGAPASGGMVHSFNGSARQATAYLDLGLHLSIGGPLVRPDNMRLRQAVQEIPIERLLLETDSPDQPPPSHQACGNEPATLLQVAEVVAAIKKVSASEVLSRSTENLKKLFSLTIVEN